MTVKTLSTVAISTASTDKHGQVEESELLYLLTWNAKAIMHHIFLCLCKPSLHETRLLWQLTKHAGGTGL